MGFDQREAVAYHVCSQSIIERASEPVQLIPLASNMLNGFDGQRNGTNAFIFSRYLIPYLCDFQGWAIFIDGDMVLDQDIAELWAHQNIFKDKAVAVVKHEYKTKHPRKYIGSDLENINVDYPRKNWSSVVLWNCAHPGNRILSPEYVREAAPSLLHRFQWLVDDDIGELLGDWNYLVTEYAPSPASLYHYTVGVPGMKHYAATHGSWKWHAALRNALECAGEDPVRMVQRAELSGAV